MGKLKAHSPIYCIMDSCENMLHLTHRLDIIYLTGISMSSDKFADGAYSLDAFRAVNVSFVKNDFCKNC